jgi:alpha-beta hydrolase superfamily lysophospholipase
VLRLKNEDFSRDPKVVEAMNADPLIAHETQPTRTVAELARADDRLRREFPAFALPLLILHGTADKATRPSGSRRFHDSAGSADKTLKLYEGHYHDLLNDVGKEAVMDDVKAWLAAHLPA